MWAAWLRSSSRCRSGAGSHLFCHKLDATTRNDEFSKLHKQLAWLFPALLAPWLASEFAPPLIVASAFLSLGIYAWVIWQIRKLVATRQTTTMNYLVLALEQRWPLALFDIWTWGLTALFLALAFGPALF